MTVCSCGRQHIYFILKQYSPGRLQTNDLSGKSGHSKQDLGLKAF